MHNRNQTLKLSAIATRMIVVAFAVYLLPSCTYYYTAVQRPSATLQERSASIRTLQDSGRYLILRHKDSAYHISRLQFREDSSIADLQLAPIDPDRMKYVENRRKRDRIYGNTRQNRDTAMLNEAHVFVTPDLRVTHDNFALHMGNVSNIETLENDAKKNKFSNNVNAVLIPVTLGMLIALVVAFVGISGWGN